MAEKFKPGFLARIAPQFALNREMARAKLDILVQRRAAMSASYAPVGGGRRSSEFRKNSLDATATMRGTRGPLAEIARDMLRNNPRVVRANRLIAGHAIGRGIRPVVTMASDEAGKDKDKIEGLIRDHLMTEAIDADGRYNLMGLQRLAMGTIPVSGEVLLRRRYRKASDGLPLPFQVQMLETDYIAEAVDSFGHRSHSRTDRGIEYGPTGRPTAYHLYAEHPGSLFGSVDVRRVDAANIAHAFHSDRPGARRGVSWYTPVMAELLDLHKLMQAALKQQEVSAMFAGIIKSDDEDSDRSDALLTLSSGAILQLSGGEEWETVKPPDANPIEPIVQMIDRTIATALMLTYEDFAGTYRGVNYTGGRMGRMASDPAVGAWQDDLVIGMQMRPLERWFKEAVYLKTFIDPDSYRIEWTAPKRPVVDPTKDYPAERARVRSGQASLSQVIREHGHDPARVFDEWTRDAAKFDELGLVFDSDPRRVSIAGVEQTSSDRNSENDQGTNQ